MSLQYLPQEPDRAYLIVGKTPRSNQLPHVSPCHMLAVILTGVICDRGVKQHDAPLFVVSACLALYTHKLTTAIDSNVVGMIVSPGYETPIPKLSKSGQHLRLSDLPLVNGGTRFQ